MIWAAVILYSAVAIGLGWVAHRKRDAGADFWTAGRSLSGVSVGLSISAGFMSVSWSCVYAVQLFYWYGLGALWLITIPWLLSLAGIYYLAQRYHALPAFSQPEMVGERFGRPTRRILAVALALVFMVWGGAEIYVAATLLSPGLNISVPTTILGITLIVGIYAALGGFRAVIATDKLQYFIVVAYVLAMGWLAVKGLAEGGPGLLPEAAIRGAKSGVSWQVLAAPGLVTILLTFVAYLPGWLFETDLWVRVQAARDQAAARRGVLLAAVNALLFVGFLPAFIGISALSLFPMSDGAFPANLGYEGDAIFAALVTQFAPEWLAILVAVGLVAAAMSTIDTCANVMGLSVAYDFLELHKRPQAARSSQLVTVAVMIACCIFALNTESLWDIFYLSGGILTTTVAFPVAAVFWPRASAKGVQWSAAAGLVGTILAYFLEAKAGLSSWEPAWLAESGLGYILWGILAAGVGYGFGSIRKVMID